MNDKDLSKKLNQFLGALTEQGFLEYAKILKEASLKGSTGTEIHLEIASTLERLKEKNLSLEEPAKTLLDQIAQEYRDFCCKMLSVES